MKVKVGELERARDYWKESSVDWQRKLKRTHLWKRLVKSSIKFNKAKKIIEKLLEDIHIAENLFNFTSQSVVKAERFLEELEK